MQSISRLKYEGELVKEGIIDARLAAGVINEIDELLRFYIYSDLPSLQRQDLQIPIKINKGSWEVEVFDLIMNNLDKGVVAIAAAAYVKKLAEKSAEDGFFETGLTKDVQKIFREANKTFYWVIKIAKHIKSLANKNVKTGKFQNNNQEIEIINEAGEILVVPTKAIDKFKSTNKKALNTIAKTIEKERTLKYTFVEEDISKTVEVSESEKEYFYFEEDEEFLFPELVHGENIEVKGRLTRLNDRSGTLGLEYQDHIITIIPIVSKSIKQFKKELISDNSDRIFPEVKVIGVVDRLDNEGLIKSKKPIIRFDQILKLEESNTNSNHNLIN